HHPRVRSFPTRRSSDLLRIETGPDGVKRARPVKSATHVVLARPDDFHGFLDRLRDLHCLANKMAVRHGAPTESAAAEHRVQLHLDRKSTRLNSSHVAIS